MAVHSHVYRHFQWQHVAYSHPIHHLAVVQFFPLCLPLV
jgi:hypothetical protein